MYTRITPKLTRAAVLAAAIALAAVAIVPSAAARVVHGPLFDEQFRAARIAHELDLDDAQRTEIHAITDRARAAVRAHVAELVEVRSALRELARSDELDEAGLRDLARKQGELTAELVVLRARVRSETDAVLTDEQLEKLASLRESRHRGAGHPGARGPGKRGGAERCGLGSAEPADWRTGGDRDERATKL